LQEVLHHHVPDPDDDRAYRGRVQFLDDLHRQRSPQPAAGTVSGAVRHRSAHPLAVRSGGGAVRHHHRRHLAVDLADLPDLPVRLLGAAPPADRRRPRHGRHPLADFLAGAAAAAQARHRDRGDHPLDGGTQDVRPGGTAHLRGPGTSTQTVAYFLWEQVWVFNKFSFGAAASVLLLIMFSVLIYVGIYLLIRQRSTVEGRT